MSLTPAQKTLLKADITGPGANATAVAAFVAVNDWSSIANYYNSFGSADAWNSQAPVRNIYDGIDWTKYTPNDAPDGTAIFTNRLLAIQTKQMNLQNMLQGRETIDASKALLRAGLRDAVIGLPSGTSGASQAAGGSSGVNLLNACTRKARFVEAVLGAGTSATTGTVSALVLPFEGELSAFDYVDAYTS